MQVVQGALSTPTGVYISVHDLGAWKRNEEIRRIYVFRFSSSTGHASYNMRRYSEQHPRPQA